MKDVKDVNNDVIVGGGVQGGVKRCHVGGICYIGGSVVGGKRVS